MKTKLGIFALLAIVAAGGFVLYNAIEVYEENVNQGWSSKALRNPFLAAEQFLTQRGNLVKSSKSLTRLDHLPDRGVVFISDVRLLQTQARVEALLAWMENGGRLIVGAAMPDDENKQLLLSHFGVTKEQADCDCDDDTTNKLDDTEVKKLSEFLRDANKQLKDKSQQKVDAAQAQKEDAIPEAELTILFFENVASPVRVHFNQSTVLNHPLFDDIYDDKAADTYQGPSPYYWESNKDGPQFMQFKVGQGVLTVLSEAEIWTSRHIGKVDHAFLLSVLVGNSNEVVLLYGLQMPSIFVLLYRNAPEFVFSFLVLLAGWLLYKTKRFGPIQEQEVTTRRSLDEHIVASMDLLWRAKKSDTIIENGQAAVFRKIKHKNLSFFSLNKNEQINWICKKCNLNKHEVEQALYTNAIANEEKFYQKVRLIQKIGHKL